MLEKELLQEEQYHFPYHHLTHEENGAIFIFRHLFWGLEHYTYIKYVIDSVIKENFNTLIDIGCGEGRIISELEKELPNKIFQGIDVSDKATIFAKGFTRGANFSVHDITKSPFPNKSDIAVSCEVIEHIKPDEIDTYCKNIAESLKDQGGVFFLTTPTTNIPTVKKHYQHFTLELLEQYLNPYFTIEEVVYLNRVNILSKILNRLIANRYFISNSKTLNRWVLQQYKKHLLFGNEKTGSRIFIKAKKK